MNVRQGFKCEVLSFSWFGLGFWILWMLGCGDGSSVVSNDADADPTCAVVVERVVDNLIPGAIDRRPELAVGDLLRGWRRTTDQIEGRPMDGQFCSWFDWRIFHLEELPRGGVEVFGERQGEPMIWEMIEEDWGVKTRPFLPPSELELYEKGHRLLAERNFAAVEEMWSPWFIDDSISELRTTLQVAIGRAQIAAEQYVAAEETLLDAHARAKTREERLALATELVTLARVQNDIDLGIEYHKRLLTEFLDGDHDYLSISNSLRLLGLIARERRDYARAREFGEHCLSIRRKLAPGSILLANALSNLALVDAAVGRLDQAQALLQEARTLAQLSPDKNAELGFLHNLSLVAEKRGDLKTAQELLADVHLRADAMGLGETLRVAGTLNNLGSLALLRGEVHQALSYFEQALAIKERRAPNSLTLARTLENLAIVAWRQGALELAEAQFRRIEAILEQHGLKPGATQQSNRALVKADRGDLDGAEALLRKALLQLEAESDTTAAGILEKDLGMILRRQGAFDEADAWLRKSLELKRERVPETVDFSRTLQALGDLEIERGRFEAAKTYLEPALRIRQRLVPGGFFEAETLTSLGRLERLRQSDLAYERLQQAMTVLELTVDMQREQQGDLRDLRNRLFREVVDLWLSRGDPEQAFAYLERWRGQSFLALLAERDLQLTEIPEEKSEDFHRLRVLYDRTLNQLASLSTTETEKIDRLRGELALLRSRRDALRRSLRDSTPLWSGSRQVETLRAEQIRRSMPSGSLMLSYLVSEEATDLFALDAEGRLSHHVLTISKVNVEAWVQELRTAIARTANGPDADFERLARKLHKLLLEPVMSEIKAARQLIIVPDGALHFLPFGALRDASTGRFLVEQAPWVVALSGTVYAELSHETSGHTGKADLVAFADPSYPTIQPVSASPKRGAPFRRQWSPLPSTQLEIERVREFFPADRVVSFVGEEAREERIRDLAQLDPRYLHFATHAFVDERSPLDSALVLSPVEPSIPLNSLAAQNGLLQVWEILENVRLNADLVVLSACETGIGALRGGEGLISLTRAFQIVGARSVLASLWQVDDVATQELIVDFYRHLRFGKSKAAALRQAQLDLIKRSSSEGADAIPNRLIQPYFWAAFQLFGDGGRVEPAG